MTSSIPPPNSVKDRCDSSTFIVKSPDMKAMCAVMENVLKQCHTSPKQSTLEKPIRSTRSQHKKTYKSKKISNANQDIREWLDSPKKRSTVDKTSGVKSPKKQRIKIESKSSKKRTIETQVKSPKKQRTEIQPKSPGKLGLSSSFLKYGVKVPSFKSILEKCKETERYIKSLEENKLPDYVEIPATKYEIKKKVERSEILDCKHLTLKEIRGAVRRHMEFIRGVESGEIYSRRQFLFYNQEPQDDLNMNDDLRYDISTSSFTDQQITQMLKMLEKKFGDRTRYFLMVLLPELCLNIFMEVHKMNYNDAIEYLKERPDTDDSDSD